MTVTARPAGQPEADAALIEQSWAKPERFAAIFERYFGQIHQYLARRVGDKAADDLAAEVFVAAFAQRQRYDTARDCARPWPPRWPRWMPATGTCCFLLPWPASTTRRQRRRSASPTGRCAPG